MANKRRSNGEGSYRQRGNSWEASIMVGYKPDGTRNVKTFTAPTKADARRKMQAYIETHERGLVDTRYTLSEWMQVYLELHAPNIKPVTQENYKYTARLITRHLGNRSLQSIRPVDIERLLLTLREEGRSDSALSQARGLLYSVMRKAVANSLIVSNPVEFSSHLRKRPPNEKEVFTRAEYKVLFASLPDNLIGHSIRILLACGLRSQELLALTREHIEPDGSAIHVRQAVSMERGHVTISTPKSYASYRTVPVPSIARESALFLRNVETHYVWQSPVADKLVNPSHFRKLYKKCLETIPGIPYLPPHNCRHSYVSLLLAQNLQAPIVQSMVGHSTVLMTQHYTHIGHSTAAQAAEHITSLIEE